ncbi:hypothetical protein PMAYCL1PPCAC_05690, partial [Pristionchus mayeri]
GVFREFSISEFCMQMAIDTPANYPWAWKCTYYYNWFFGVHAFCAESICLNEIQKNGIGYDMNFGNGPLGKAVSESSIAAVRTACPTGSKNLRNLGFTKSGSKYLHNLDGAGLKQGWVSTVSGACGASIPMKRWKSRFTDDMMYARDLDWNTWYRGMEQDGGAVQFYLWP